MIADRAPSASNSLGTAAKNRMPASASAQQRADPGTDLAVHGLIIPHRSWRAATGPSAGPDVPGTAVFPIRPNRCPDVTGTVRPPRVGAPRRPARRPVDPTAATPAAGVSASSSRRTKAEPTMTPSAYAATSAAWAGGRHAEAHGHRQRRARAACARRARARRPRRWLHAGDAHERGGVHEARRDAATTSMRASVLLGATRNTRSRPASSVAAIQGPASSGVRSGVMTPDAAGGGEVAGEPLDAVALDRVPVGHDERRARRCARLPRPCASTSLVVVPCASELLGRRPGSSGRP